MKKLISLLACMLIFALCTNREVLDRIAGDDSHREPLMAGSPIMIDGGTKIVYQFGHMTPDKGLKLYYDTIPATATIPSDDFLKDLQ
ncbi:hypothetical protein KK083_19250 [Fulvivirgaceae bacterium PWU4]|uniref:Uncharacterized protein n=1 Tax=Chryseosolibacter histidini TaxID=2782349 RepID=A0AAP2GQK6_9BACT|nr:hypothetical protein [Chryseosolibacter histidini]MBT1699040.1 hypothetical protein [Chryseosolibacter histidini]